MNIRLIFHIIGALIFCLALSMLIPLACAVYFNDPDIKAWILSLAVTGISGGLIWGMTYSKKELSNKDGFAVVTLSWLILSFFGSLPYLFSHVLPHPVDAFFETMSGFTTTGATVITNIDPLPHGILLWRALTQWFGGMGIIVLSIAILPLLGVGGMQLFKAEVPGPQKDRLTPRIANTAKVLWAVYVLFSVAETILLRIGGMSWYESVCHTFTTMSTGGFSTRNASVAGFGSAYIDWIIIIFMFLAGVNFALHYNALRGRLFNYFKDGEFLLYGTIYAVATGMIFINILKYYGSFPESIRHATFQVVSIGTTTGYCTQDFDLWPTFSRLLLLLLMFFGGCAGSTGGGIKIVRIYILVKQGLSELKRLIYPQSIVPVRLKNKFIPSEVVTNVQVFFLVYMALFVISSLIMAALGLDFITAISSVAATLGNIGPGLALVGASQNYAFMPMTGKVVLSLCMLIGRLEIFTVLVAVTPTFWKK